MLDFILSHGESLNIFFLVVEVTWFELWFREIGLTVYWTRAKWEAGGNIIECIDKRISYNSLSVLG